MRNNPLEQILRWKGLDPAWLETPTHFLNSTEAGCSKEPSEKTSFGKKLTNTALINAMAKAAGYDSAGTNELSFHIWIGTPGNLDEDGAGGVGVSHSLLPTDHISPIHAHYKGKDELSSFKLCLHDFFREINDPNQYAIAWVGNANKEKFVIAREMPSGEYLLCVVFPSGNNVFLILTVYPITKGHFFQIKNNGRNYITVETTSQKSLYFAPPSASPKPIGDPASALKPNDPQQSDAEVQFALAPIVTRDELEEKDATQTESQETKVETIENNNTLSATDLYKKGYLQPSQALTLARLPEQFRNKNLDQVEQDINALKDRNQELIHALIALNIRQSELQTEITTFHTKLKSLCVRNNFFEYSEIHQLFKAFELLMKNKSELFSEYERLSKSSSAQLTTNIEYLASFVQLCEASRMIHMILPQRLIDIVRLATECLRTDGLKKFFVVQQDNKNKFNISAEKTTEPNMKIITNAFMGFVLRFLKALHAELRENKNLEKFGIHSQKDLSEKYPLLIKIKNSTVTGMTSGITPKEKNTEMITLIKKILASLPDSATQDVLASSPQRRI